MRDEEVFLLQKEDHLKATNLALAFQVHRYRKERTRFFNIHHWHFEKLAQDPLFTGSIVAGTPLDKTLLTTINPKLSMDVDSPEEDLGQMSGSEDEDHSDDKDTLQTVAALEALAA
ncbi:hypothetical protein C0991_006907, partial [Blastosporella zonata]